MIRILMACLLVSTPVLAQSRLPGKARAPADPCAPIGQLADRTPVYSLRCTDLPAPPPAQAAAPVESDVQRSGLFGMSYSRRRPDE